MSGAIKKSDGLPVLIYFVAFFSLILVVNGIFIYMALKTHSGVIVEQPYEKGLAFNEILETAKSQQDIEHKPDYTNGTLRWVLPAKNASVTASMIRPVRDGHDFKVTLKHIGNGVYEANPTMPFPGAWTAKLKATWNNQTLQASHEFIAK